MTKNFGTFLTNLSGCFHGNDHHFSAISFLLYPKRVGVEQFTLSHHGIVSSASEKIEDRNKDTKTYPLEGALHHNRESTLHHSTAQRKTRCNLRTRGKQTACSNIRTCGTGTRTPSLLPLIVARRTRRTASLAPLVRKMLLGSARWPSRRSMKSHTYDTDGSMDRWTNTTNEQ